MSCTGCASKFGFLKSEHGCPGCGFSYCGKCLSEKVVLREGSKPVSVCRKCALERTPDRRLSHPIQGSNISVGKQDRTPPSMRSSTKVRATSIASTSPAEGEQALRERLERLRQEMKGPPVSQTELEIRLAKLKGKSFDEHVAEKATSHSYFGPDNRTPAKRAEDLMSQMREEMELERRQRRPEQDLEYRLAKLKEDIPHPDSPREIAPVSDRVCEQTTEESVIPGVTNVDDEDNKELNEVERVILQAQKDAVAEAKAALRCLEKDKELREYKRLTSQKEKNKEDIVPLVEEDLDEDDNAEAEKIANMILEEEDLNRRLSQLAPPPSTLGDASPDQSNISAEWQDELPWCCICNEDAILRCVGCGGDLYCRRCFRQGHDQFDIKDHHTVPYENKNVDLSE